MRRVTKHFPDAKIIFAHPFVNNPEAQFSKHGLSTENTYAKSYTQGSVGRICVFQHANGKSYQFSPYIDDGHHINNSLELPGSFKEFALNGQNTILIYVSKGSIYSGNFADDFSEYIDRLAPVEDETALAIIAEIKHTLGADIAGHNSSMVKMLEKGIVIHHGSIPLEVRFLMEDFIRGGYAQACFATSTLAQGINMPFDIVWLMSNRFMGNEEERALAFKNLIGRAGRLSKENKFDYGYVFTSNPRNFSRRIKSSFSLQETSVIESTDTTKKDSDTKELVDSIQNDTFDDDKNLPMSKVARLSQDEVLESARKFLEILYREPTIKDSIGGASNRAYRDQALRNLKVIYEASLGRPLQVGEQNVFEKAIRIFFQMAQGRSFREIVGIIYNHVTARDDRSITRARFIQPAEKLPNSLLSNAYSLFPDNTPIDKVNYDTIVYDTYDYMDQVISFSLSDVFVAAFQVYQDSVEDARAEQIIELFRFGTNNSKHILLMRYGFPPEMVTDVSEHVAHVDEQNIAFRQSINSAPKVIKDFAEWYLPQNSA